MSEIREGLVEVIGASIHYQVSGHGPTLLLLSPGDGDADVFSGIVPLLDGFTVVTCDRRGQGRSPIVDPAEPVTIATHADDMARVLVAVTTHAARGRSGSASAPSSGSSWWPGIRIGCRRSSRSSRRCRHSSTSMRRRRSGRRAPSSATT